MCTYVLCICTLPPVFFYTHSYLALLDLHRECALCANFYYFLRIRPRANAFHKILILQKTKKLNFSRTCFSRDARTIYSLCFLHTHEYNVNCVFYFSHTYRCVCVVKIPLYMSISMGPFLRYHTHFLSRTDVRETPHTPDVAVQRVYCAP